MNTTQYLDLAKKRLGIESDYALAPHLELSRQAVSKLRNGVVVMSNTTAARIAAILDVDLVHVIADMELERASSSDQRAFWKQIRDAAVVAVMAIGAACFGVPPPAAASTLHNYFSSSVSSSSSSGPYYALHTI